MPTDTAQLFQVKLNLTVKTYDIDYGGVVSNIVYVEVIAAQEELLHKIQTYVNVFQ